METLTPPYDCRLFRDPPLAGAFNMALDELLLDEVSAGSGPTRGAGQPGAAEPGPQAPLPAWRFYQWAEPTVSLGYFQHHDERTQHGPSAACALVRRPTGGGAIVHDAELTYSFVVPAGHPLAGDAMSLYRAIHGTLIETLASLDVPAEMSAIATEGPAAEQPFLCFERRAVGDVLLGGAKIAGSAQRRLADAVLQHGSILLRASVAAPNVPGIAELTGRELPVAELIDRWQTGLAAALAVRWQIARWTSRELTAAERLATTKYATTRWNRLR
ncbi:MAG: hypothetical protein K1X74_10255 [Pirellulales bacterium]|nr:hypothetical protein [Pirellulales bacterium]